jgi:hypothetical protein
MNRHSVQQGIIFFECFFFSIILSQISSKREQLCVLGLLHKLAYLASKWQQIVAGGC